MKMKNHPLTDEEIDELVIAQADEMDFWEEPIHVKRENPIPVPISSGLMARAKFLASLHRAEKR